MALTKEEIRFLKGLVEVELKRIHKDEKEMNQFEPIVPFIAIEEKYDLFLEKLKKKLK